MTMYQEENDDVDEFFGNQDDDDDTNDNDFGGLGEQENRAREAQLQNIGYLESYDETKDIQLQEGFEVGYRETLDVATRIGKLLGRATIQARLTQPVSETLNDESSNSSGTAATRHTRQFLTTFEARPKDHVKTTKDDLELLEEEVKRIVEK